MGSVQCYRCKLFGHYSGDCREKTPGYLAMAKPFVKGTSEVVVSAEYSGGNKNQNNNKNKNKNKNKNVSVVVESDDKSN